MAIVTGGEKSIRPEGGVWFWEDHGEVYFSISDPELPGHSTIGTVQPGTSAFREIHDLLVAKGRKLD